ncbi:Zinc finger MYM-type protein 1-like [Oopsacas minuta]|uniref:Zinc finger MYM-type protein 1-like n=1 Tax=Oopsacas minuta TaxID=111878 RepID=A0AAV7JZW3_9METZ|nr:Zinc finger MYM-type protein 1-like [Oopsacas minuta]
MDIRRFISGKRSNNNLQDMNECTSEELSQITSERCLPSSSQNPEVTRHDPTPLHSKKYHMSSSEQRKQYKANLSYKNEWEKIYPGDAAVTAGMSKQVECGKSELELQCSAAAKEAACRAERNRSIVLKLMRSIYFLTKNKIPHTTVYPNLIALQVANGDALLEEHLTHVASNAQYTSKFSAVMLLDALDTWLERKQIQSLRSSPCFSILADECQDISTQEELSICCGWIVDGYPEEHFVDILHIKDVDAASITQALTTFIEVNNLDYRRLVGQGYDGAATFSGCTNGVQKKD